MALALSNLRIRTRLYGGFGLLIVLALVIAGFGATRLWAVGDDVGAMARAAEETAQVQRIVDEFEIIRRATLRYYDTADKEALDQTRQATETARGLLKNATAQARTDEARKAYSGIAEEFEAYNTQTASMITTRGAITAQRVAISDRGAKLTDATARVAEQAQVAQDISVAVLAGEVTKATLEMRLIAWKFLATVDPGFVRAFQAARDGAQGAMGRLEQFADPQTKDLVAPMKAAFAEYVRAFDEVSASMVANREVYWDRMVPMIEKLQSHLADWSAVLDKRFGAARQSSVATVSAASTLQLIVAGVALVVGLLAAFITGRGIVRPLAGMTDTMHRLAGGDTDVTVPSLGATDEVGEMAKAVEVFKANMVSNAEMAAAQQREQARKELRQGTVDGCITEFDTSIRDMLHMLASAATEMQAAAQSMAQTANQTNDQAATMATAAEQASANVQTMAAATEEMAASANEISNQVARSAQITARAVESARHTDHQVQSLSEAAQRIEDVVAIINGIAGQTNLLALNATIEAARAGDAGKGFAVVASEVKALAGQTGKATEEIGAQIQAIQLATREAVDAIKAISATINEVNDISTAIAAAMEEQGATTSEMTRNTQEAAKGTQEVSATISGVSHGANATGAAASQVLSAAGELGRQAERLRAEVDGFLGKIRAA